MMDILPVDLVVCADMNRDNCFFVNEQFDGYSTTDVHENGMKPLQVPFQGMKPKGWMLGIEFKELECLFVLPDQLRMFLEETGGPFCIAFCEDDFIAHGGYA